MGGAAAAASPGLCRRPEELLLGPDGGREVCHPEGAEGGGGKPASGLGGVSRRRSRPSYVWTGGGRMGNRAGKL